MLERRRNWASLDRAWKEAAEQLQATGCGLYLKYGQVQQKQMQKLLKAANRSHQDLDGYVITTADGGRHFFVNAESARFVVERLGPAVEEGQTSSGRIEVVMERLGYKAQRGWGVHSGARIFSGMPRSDQSPLSPSIILGARPAWSLANPGPPVSLREFTCNHLGSRDSLKRQGIVLPEPNQLARHFEAAGSHVDDGAISVVPSEKEIPTMMTRDQANELLELQRAMLREQMEQTELLRKQMDRTQDDTDPHHVPARRRTQ